MELLGRTALVTGAARRVGREIALALARRGMDVVVHYRRSAPEARATVAEVERLGRRAVGLEADLARPDEVEALADRSIQALGAIDVLVNSAALFYRTPLDKVAWDDWEQVLRVNLIGPSLLARRLGLEMRRRGEGKIVNIADVAGMRPWTDFLPYCVSKAALIALTRGLARALAPQVHVNAVAPGTVLLADEYGEKEREAIVRATPLKRIGDPGDVANAVLFLLEGSDFITGQVIVVDGGRSVV
jgi:NAD(P)-dependent dehydrogenase (short-subunit alcohol dehydrogenase family)